MKKATLTLVLFAFILTSLAGCGSTAAQKDEEVYKLDVVMDNVSINRPLVVIAKLKGYFEEEGLDVTYTNLTSGVIEAISIGKSDATLSGIIPSLTYAAQKAELTVFAGTASGGNFIISLPEKAEELSDINNWKGKKLGTVRLSTSELVSRSALEKRGIDISKDITYVEIDSYPNIVEAVRKGTIDIGFVSSEYGKIGIDLGLEILFPMTDMSENYVCCRQTAYTPSVKGNRDAFVKFLKGQIRAYKDFNEQQDEVVKLLAEYSSQTEEYVYDYLYNPEFNANRTFSPDPAINKIREVYETLEKWDYVEEGVKVEDFVHITLYQDALKSILEEYPDEPVFKTLEEAFQKDNF